MITVFRCPSGDGAVAAEQDLIVWADGHALRAGAVVDVEPEMVSRPVMVLGLITATCASGRRGRRLERFDKISRSSDSTRTARGRVAFGVLVPSNEWPSTL